MKKRRLYIVPSSRVVELYPDGDMMLYIPISPGKYDDDDNDRVRGEVDWDDEKTESASCVKEHDVWEEW